MTRTTLKNYTSGVVVLREGHAQVFRTVCNIVANGRYTVLSELNQTYKEYLCSSSDGSSQITLSSDDLSQWKEIVIRPSATILNQVEWVGTISALKRSTRVSVQDTNTTSSGLHHPPVLSKMGNKLRGWFSMKPAETGTTTITRDPATASSAPATASSAPATASSAPATASSAPAFAAPAPGTATAHTLERTEAVVDNREMECNPVARQADDYIGLDGY